MSTPAHAPSEPPRHRWGLLETAFGDRIRESDAVWARSLSPAARIALVEELLCIARSAHEREGDWAAVEARAWAETLAERRRLVAECHRLDEVQRGTKPVADAG